MIFDIRYSNIFFNLNLSLRMSSIRFITRSKPIDMFKQIWFNRGS